MIGRVLYLFGWLIWIWVFVLCVLIAVIAFIFSVAVFFIKCGDFDESFDKGGEVMDYFLFTIGLWYSYTRFTKTKHY